MKSFLRLTLVGMVFLFTVHANAIDVRVRYKNKSYQTSFSENYVSFKSIDINLSFTKLECSSSLIQSYVQDFQKMLKVGLSQNKNGGNAVDVMVEKTNYKIDPNSKAGIFLLNLSDRILRMKVLEKIKCEN